MTREDLEKRVTEIVIESVIQYGSSGSPKENIKPTTNIIEEFNCDSLDCIEMLMAIEAEFGIGIPEADAEKLKTVTDVVDYLVSKGC